VDVEGYSHEETAEILDVAVGTVKSRTSRARLMVRQRLETVDPTGKPGTVRTDRK
jgi:RNA polymerase sigma-70 factor (ECF subfamily)